MSEYEFLATMSLAAKLLEAGRITNETYCRFQTMMVEKYHPKIGAFMPDN